MTLLTAGYTWLRDQLATQTGEAVTATFIPADDNLPSFTSEVIARAIIGGDEFPDDGSEVRILRTAIYVARSVFTDEEITEPPVNMAVNVHGATWYIDMAVTEWGKTLVKLGLEREAKLNEWQARRATV
jgi:hypothetical protein